GEAPASLVHGVRRRPDPAVVLQNGHVQPVGDCGALSPHGVSGVRAAGAGRSPRMVRPACPNRVAVADGGAAVRVRACGLHRVTAADPSLPVAVLIPALEPDNSLADLVQALLGLSFSAVIVVDDGSTPACEPI